MVAYPPARRLASRSASSIRTTIVTAGTSGTVVSQARTWRAKSARASACNWGIVRVSMVLLSSSVFDPPDPADPADLADTTVPGVSG